MSLESLKRWIIEDEGGFYPVVWSHIRHTEIGGWVHMIDA